MFESHLFTEALVFGEFVGMGEAYDGQMFLRGLEVLSKGKNIDALLDDILHCAQDFVALLAKPQHHSRFCGYWALRVG